MTAQSNIPPGSRVGFEESTTGKKERRRKLWRQIYQAI